MLAGRSLLDRRLLGAQNLESLPVNPVVWHECYLEWSFSDDLLIDDNADLMDTLYQETSCCVNHKCVGTFPRRHF